MTVAERIYKSKNRYSGFTKALIRQAFVFSEIVVYRLIFIDGSILVWRAYLNDKSCAWSVEK